MSTQILSGQSGIQSQVQQTLEPKFCNHSAALPHKRLGELCSRVRSSQHPGGILGHSLRCTRPGRPRQCVTQYSAGSLSHLHKLPLKDYPCFQLSTVLQEKENMTKLSVGRKVRIETSLDGIESESSGFFFFFFIQWPKSSHKVELIIIIYMHLSIACK